MLSVLFRRAPVLRRAYLPWVVVALLVPMAGPRGVPLAAAELLGRPKAPAIPRALRAAYIASVQTGASATLAYRVDPASRTAHNPRQKLAARLDTVGLRLAGTTDHQDFHATLALKSYGCADQPRAAYPVQPTAAQNRVEYVRAGLTEWYVNGPLGVEQGFTLAAAPRCAAAQGVAVQLQWDTNLLPALVGAPAATAEAPGQRLELRNPAGRTLLAYSELYAFDAAGKQLPAQLALAGTRLTIHVDDRGATYPVTIDPLIWSQQSKLLSSDGISGDTFASSVAISGDTAIVGDPFHDYFSTNQGAAYVFVRSNTQWTQQQRILASDYSTNDNFGTAVAISGDTAVVGAPNHFGTALNSGQIYVYVRTGTTWTEQTRFTGTGAAANDFFGRSVAVDVDTMVVGAPAADLTGQVDAGAAYVFLRTGNTWTQQQKLTAADALAADAFGSAVALSGNTAVIGAPKDDTTGGGVDAGSAYVFLRTGTTWAQQQQLFAMDGVTTDLFGSSAAISVDTAVIGSPQADPGGITNAGAAYVFFRTGTSWAPQQKLTAADGSFNDNLGAAVAIAVDSVVLGSPLADSALGGTDSGAAYVWTRSGTTWTVQMKLTAADAVAGDQLGGAVAITVDTVLAGAPLRTESFSKKGAAYVFFRGLSTGDTCATAGQCVSNICINNTCRSGKLQGISCLSAGECATNFCVDGVCCDTACGGGLPDCQACSVSAGAPTSGTCSVAPAGRACRAKANECDVAEVCDGAAPLCPTDSGIADGMPCAFGTCHANLCVSDGPLAYVPARVSDGSQATGCELTSRPSAPPATAVAGVLALLVLALLWRTRRKVGGLLFLGVWLVGAPALAEAAPPEPAAAAGAPTAASEFEPAPALLREEVPVVPAPSALRQQERGLVLLCNFSARLFMIAADGSNTPSQTALQGGIFGGYKLGRWLVGLGFDLSNFTTETLYSDGTNTAKGVVANTGLVFSPGVQVAILRSSDHRLELIGAAQLGLGTIISRSDQDPALPQELQVENNQQTFYLQYRLAPGLRVWALPQLAFNLLSGFSGDHLFTFTNNPSGNHTDQRASTAFFVNLGAMGVF